MKKYLKFSTIFSAFTFFAYIFLPTFQTDESSLKLSDGMLYSIYHQGKKTHRITYEDIKLLNRTKTITSSYFEEIIQPTEDKLQEIHLGKHNAKCEGCKCTNSCNKEKEEKTIRYTTYNKLNTTKDFLYKKNFTHDFQADVDQMSDFSKSLYEIFGNHTVFKMDIFDLEELVRRSVMSDGEAIILWESLLAMKTNRLSLYLKSFENSTEIYLIGFFPLKSIVIFIITMTGFWVLYNVHQYMSKMNINSYSFYFINIAVSYFLAFCLYQWTYYLSSSLIFMNLTFTIKNLTEYFLLNNFRISKDDLDLNQDTKTNIQLAVKMALIIISGGIVCLMIMLQFGYSLNYIIFYIIILKFITTISSYLKNEVASCFIPCKNFILLCAGLLNYLLTNYHKKLVRYSYLNQQVDSFYIISEIFSFLAISNLYTFLMYQCFNIMQNPTPKQSSDEVIEEEELEEQSENNDSNPNPNKTVHGNKICLSQRLNKDMKFFTTDDVLWILVIGLAAFMFYSSLCFTNYFSFYLTLHFIKLIMHIFCSLFKVQFTRIILSLYFLNHILANSIISFRSDTELFKLLGIESNQIIDIVKFSARLIGIIYLILDLVINYEYLYLFNERAAELDESENEEILRKVEISTSVEKEKRKKKKIKTIEIHLVRGEGQKLSFRNLFYINTEFFLNYMIIISLIFLTKNIEKNFFIKVMYDFILFIFYLRFSLITSEFKNAYEYLYASFLTIFYIMRILSLTQNMLNVYITTCIYFFFFTTIYCIVDRKKFLFTIVFIFNLTCGCLNLKSNFLLVLILVLIFIPLGLINNDINANLQISYKKFIFPATLIVVCQLIGFQNILFHLDEFNKYMVENLELDIFYFSRSMIEIELINEISIMDTLFRYALLVLDTVNLV